MARSLELYPKAARMVGLLRRRRGAEGTDLICWAGCW